MTVDHETFLTSQKKDYKWPYAKPMAPRPSQPPQRTKPNNFYVAKLVEPYCHCDAHLYEPQMGRYKKLAEKEKMLYQELDELNKQMTVLSIEMLDNPCDTYDDKMESIYQTDYLKRGLHVVEYRKLMPAIDSPTGVPVKSQTIGLQQGYRDPTSFRLSAFNRPNIDVCTPTTFSTTPKLIDDWFTLNTGISEYEDTISKMGLGVIKSSQQYAEPLPSSRRRVGNPCM